MLFWIYGSDFNYDFHVTLDESVAPPEYETARLLTGVRRCVAVGELHR